MTFGKTSFNVDALKGLAEKTLRSRLSGVPEGDVNLLVDYMSKEGFVKRSKTVEDKEGGE